MLEILSTEALIDAAGRDLASGHLNAARTLTSRLLSAAPDCAAAIHLRGLVEVQDGNYGDAVVWLQRALALHPDRYSWRNDLGIAYAGEGDWQSAADAFAATLNQNPSDFTALLGYGRAILELGTPPNAIEYLRKSLALEPESANALTTLARALAAAEKFKEAAELLSRASVIDPENDEPYRLLGRICATCEKVQLALSCWENVLRLVPRDEEALAGLIHCHWRLGDLQQTLALSRILIDDGRASIGLHSFWLYIQLYDPAETAATVKNNCEMFCERITPARIASFRSDFKEDQARPLRVGYVSSEFYSGAAYHFLYPLIGNHDKRKLDIFLYETRGLSDCRTELFRPAGHWRECFTMDDRALERQIREDQIDILVDTTGFLPDNRLSVFAGRAAPIQVAYPNCPMTTGIKAIDYILTDRWTCPPGHEAQYTEQPVFLPSGYLAYIVPEMAPEVPATPALRNGFITFGMFQRFSKTNARVWDLIAEVLRRAPGSRLLIQNNDPTLDGPDSRSRAEVRKEFSNRNIDLTRLTMLGVRPQAAAMACMSEADIALDTFPYQGQTTTCECLWMGVPVVTLSGKHHVARVGSAIMERVGLGNLATETDQAYVECALELAGDVPRLAYLRAGMRDRIRASTLLNGRNLAREVEAAYRSMWNAWRTAQGRPSP